MKNIKVVIMAGGKGTRISSVASDIPKPMIKVDGKPVLEREIECLKKQGFNDLIITVSHLGDVISNYFGDGSKFGVKIEYFYEKTPLGNAGALFQIKEKLSDTFLLLNGDVVFDVDFIKFVEYHFKKGGLVTLFTHPNSHPYDSSIIIIDKNKSVERWLSSEDPKPTWYKNRVNAGLHVVDKRVLDVCVNTSKVDLDRQILKPLQGTGKMFVYDSPEYVKDMGTPDRYLVVCNDFKKGMVEKRNLNNKQKAIFLDRDGTINNYVGFLKNIDEFRLIDGVADSIKRVNNSDYLCIVVTNQPVIARGEVTFSQLEEIHNKMETLLGNKGAYIDGLYFCPHHPHSGFVGEVSELKIDCDCRKPKPGMLIAAAKDFNVDLTNSFMIGDGINDMMAGKNAGCKTVFLGSNKEIEEADYCCESLPEAIELILRIDSK